MLKQIIAIIVLVSIEWGLAYFYFWYKTNEAFPFWGFITIAVVLGIINALILNLYASGKNANK